MIYRMWLILSLVLCSFAATAHDYWFESDGDDYLLHRGHRYSQHGGEREVPFDPSIVRHVTCLLPDRDIEKPARISSSYPVRVSGPCGAVIALIDSGYWSQTLTGTVNQPKDSLFGVLRSWQAIESVKRIDTWDDRLLAPVSTELELVFTENPFALSPGDKLRLLTYLDGRPVGGVTVAYDGDPRGVSGEDGHINIRMRHAGLQVVTASLEESLESPRADRRVRSAILMFHLPE